MGSHNANIFINLKKTSYHLIVITNQLLLFFQKKTITKITKKLLILVSFIRIKKSLLLVN